VTIITPKSGLITGIVALWARHYASAFFLCGNWWVSRSGGKGGGATLGDKLHRLLSFWGLVFV